jgi:hypothetical protein
MRGKLCIGSLFLFIPSLILLGYTSNSAFVIATVISTIVMIISGTTFVVLFLVIVWNT